MCFSAGCMPKGTHSDTQNPNSPLSPNASSLAYKTDDVTECGHMQVLLIPMLLEDFCLFSISTMAAVPQQASLLPTPSSAVENRESLPYFQNCKET